MRLTRHVVIAAVTAVLSALLVVSPASPASAQDHYTPPRGVKTNNPLGSTADKYIVWNHIVRSIRSVPPGGKIRIASWNIRSWDAEKALMWAHQRGVSVRVIMDVKNTDHNSGIWKLRRDLARHGNSSRPRDMRSWMVFCHGGCRYAGGIPHTKFFLFSKAGSASNVSIWSSGNLTRTAAVRQWDDSFTTRSAGIYDYLLNIFNQMTFDRNRANPFSTKVFWGTDLYDWMRLYIFPWRGANTPGDPMLTVLNNVRCIGAQGAGIDGHTVVRIAQTATTGQRGLNLANKLVYLKRHGCIIRMDYAVMGNVVMNTLRRGGVRFHQVVKDHNHDYVYEYYLHTKLLTVNGWYQDRRNARETWNGSSNWTGLSLGSDETFVHIKSARVTKRYDYFIDRWFFHPPKNARMPAAFARHGVDPYALIEVN